MLRKQLASFFFLAWFAGCGSVDFPSSAKIGIDPTWSPQDFGKLQPFVNGYVEDLLITVSKKHKIEMVKMKASWDNLLLGLQNGTYDAILSSMPPYSYNRANFEFSANILSLSPVIISLKGSKIQELGDLKGKIVGVVLKSEANTLLETDPSIVIRTYVNPREMLLDLSQNVINAALLEQPFASSYVQHLYQDILQIAKEPLTNAGLHLITRKNDTRLIEFFNQQIETGDLVSLQKKWNLCVQSYTKYHK